MILQQFNSMPTMSHPAFYVTENVVLCKYQGTHAPSLFQLEDGGGKNFRKSLLEGGQKFIFWWGGILVGGRIILLEET